MVSETYRLFEKPSRWGSILAVILVSFGVSIFFAVPLDGDDLGVNIMWPKRLSRSVDGDLVVVVFGTGSSGKTSLIRALLRDIVGEVGAGEGRLGQAERGPRGGRGAA